MPGKSPTARTLAELRSRGYLTQAVEHWHHFSKRRVDLFGFIDVIALREGEVLGVQATSRSNMSAREKKIRASEYLEAVLASGMRILVMGWGKMASGRWEVREVWIERERGVE